MIIDCDGCAVRGKACGECVISVVLGAPPDVDLDGAQRRAIAALSDVGLVPRLRLSPAGEAVVAAAADRDTPEFGQRAQLREPIGERHRRVAG